MTRIVAVATAPINVVSATPLLAKLQDAGAQVELLVFVDPPPEYADLPVSSIRRVAPASTKDRILAQVRMRLLGGSRRGGPRRWVVRAKNDSRFAASVREADIIMAMDESAVLLAWTSAQANPRIGACYGPAAALADVQGRVPLDRPGA